MTVIGSGMLAKAFEASYIERQGLVMFCSGVSNSNETSSDQFSREKALLLKTIQGNSGRKIVYFSSCAAGLINTPYYQHKMAMEQVVMSMAEQYLIVRLPQVVGLAKNATLVIHIAGCIRSKTPITVFRGAKRNLIDVDDVVRLTYYLVDLDNMLINVTNANMVPVEEIVRMISVVLGNEPIILAGPPDADAPDYDGGPLMELIGTNDPIYSLDYNQAVLAKYVPLLCK